MQITLVEVAKIKDRENSQRKEYKDIEELADSISRLGLIHPIVVDKDLRLVAGGRRLEAVKLLKLEKIWVTTKEELNEPERRAIELEENVKRKDLSWQDEALAVLELDKLLSELFPDKSRDARAAYIGYKKSWYHELRKVGKAIQANHPRVLEASSAHAAYNILEREESRKEDNVLNKLYDELSNKVEEDLTCSETNPAQKQKGGLRVKAQPKVFQNENFIPWVQSYNGSRFNFIHCDFPYGINHDKSDQGTDDGNWDSYSDSPEIYFQLIKHFCINRDKFMLPSCHIMFWFSMKFYEETIKIFSELAPEIEINYMPLIWHKTDNKGIVRDVTRTPRHVYETALWMSRGDRKIIRVVGDVYGAPTGKSTSIHVSQKPVPVLRHFFQLAVDEYTELLDPTCGSGTAIQAAHDMGAKRVLGLEVNPEYCEAAQKSFEQSYMIEQLRKKGDGHGG